MSEIAQVSKDIPRALTAVARNQLCEKTDLTNNKNLQFHAKLFALMAGILGIGVACQAAVLPASTAIPIQFTHTMDAGKKGAPGSLVTAKTMQAVLLPGGQVLPKGASVVGHVVDSRPFRFNPAPYTTQQPSYLSIHFDKIVTKGTEIPLNVSLRVLADYFESYDASTPHYLDETDSGGTMVQIGGDQFSPIGKELLSSDGDIVGYIRDHSVFGRLISNAYVSQYSNFRCDSTVTEQSLAIFSPSACGLYGFGSIYMSDNGHKDGTFRLESRRRTVKLYSGSTALLEVN